MIEQKPVAGGEAVRFAIVYGHPVRVNLGRAIRAAGIKFCCLTLRPFLYQSEHFAAAGLIKSRFRRRLSRCLKNSGRPYASDVPGVLGDIETDPDMALR